MSGWLDPADLPITVRLREQEVVLYDSYHALLNKPTGYLTALTDAHHAVAYDLLSGAPLKDELRPVGRLDLDTSGLLLWTTDGPWLQRLTHPKRQVPRTYHAALARPFLQPPPRFTLADGYQPNITQLDEIDGSRAHPALSRADGAERYASITITGGAYHEVRRIFAALGSHVTALCRVRFGNAVLPEDLSLGEYRRVKPEDVLEK
jgi:16S rRNA pseudouridine516 synthase